MLNSNEINTLKKFSNNYKHDINYVLAMAKKDKIDFVYNTSALEGNAMTYPEVQTLLEGITVGGHKLSDEQQILNQSRSVDLLLKMVENNTFKLDNKTVCALHFEVAREEALSWGKFRDTNVNIGGTEYIPPNYTDLKTLFESGLRQIRQIEDPLFQALSYFLFGARTQLFFDGNKRTSRLMMNGILLSHGLPLLSIKAKDKLEFNTVMILFYDSGNYIEALKYLSSYYQKQNLHLERKDGKLT